MNLIKSNWTHNDLLELANHLATIQDLKYKKFNDKIINTTSKTIGVQIPKLRKIAKEILKGNYITLLNLETPDIFELHIIHSLLLCQIKDIDTSLKYFESFILKINNWAVCDLICAEYKTVKQDIKLFKNKIANWCESNNEFVVRTGLILMLKNYINTDIDFVLETISKIDNNKYYVIMGIAWTLSIAYLRHPNKILNYLQNTNLNNTVKIKTYQKIIESNQVSTEEKESIKKLKTQARALNTQIKNQDKN